MYTWTIACEFYIQTLHIYRAEQARERVEADAAAVQQSVLLVQRNVTRPLVEVLGEDVRNRHERQTDPCSSKRKREFCMGK